MTGFPWTERLPGGLGRALSPALGRALVVALGFAVALASGFAATGESLHAIVFVGVVGIAGLFLLGITHPRVLFALLLPHVIFMPVVPVIAMRGMNPLDVLLPIALVTTWLLAPRHRMAASGDPVLEARHRDLVRAGVAYYLVALLSLAVLAARGAVGEALDSLVVLSRSLQAASLFYLVSRHVHGRNDVRFVRNALFGGILLAALVNFPLVTFLGLPRAGAGLILNDPAVSLAAVSWAVAGMPIVITSPNELASACVLVWALLLAVPPRRKLLLPALGLSFLLLLATQSRSGLLAWATLVLVHGVRTGKGRLLLLPLVAAAIVAILPHDLQGRLLRTVVMERGSFEMYTSFIRLYSWQTSLEVLRAHPILGVGYLGFRFVSHDYNALGLRLPTVENFFLETAAGMGFVGLLALAAVAVASWRLGRAARRRSEPGSPAHRLGAITPAFLVAIAAGNMTGDNLIGLLNGAQFVVFLALLSRVALLPDCRRRAPTGRL